ncbi:putative disease resistance protein RGA1 [Olea europaea var. sylvestris]|uniref:putative disease resistance protein RGA1 n=1 Tax=Olea europaea var. sylvestris TaxID=158386 RepID=UPI000C1CF729|nr:putative disease resistance protein RGA1 [Olea europaea var. sylvestris]
MWNVDDMKWEPLKNSLQGAPGSRILTTTRSDEVVRVIGTNIRQSVGLLSPDDYWSLLSRIAFFGRSEEERKELEGIGREISTKCKGLPLAAKIMGSLLRLKDIVIQWRNVLESPLWQLKVVEDKLFLHLYLSYNDLSPECKCCFSSCIIYPKDTLIHLDELIMLWIAHGYLGSSGNVDSMQVMGLEFFKNLVMQSFLQELEMDKYDESKISCKMHDIMHDFVTHLSQDNYCLILDDEAEITNCDIGKVRTCCVRNVSQISTLLNLFSGLKCVRVLIVRNCLHIPQEIGKLIHLRYLDLISNFISELPETLCDLSNLQTLDLRKCIFLSALPQGIYKLRSLRHLLFDAWKTNSISQGLERLTGLWILSSFTAGRGSSKLGYLRKLNKLRGSLELILGDLTQSEDLVDAKKAELEKKKYIKKLNIIFRREVRADIMEALQPPPKLRSLGFVKYVGNEFLGIMETIQELPNTGPAFPKLRKLHFSEFDNWETWEDITGDEKEHLLIMPCLRELEISYCDKLKALPHCLLSMASSLEYLTIKRSLCLGSLYGERTGDEWDKISHIPTLRYTVWKI